MNRMIVRPELELLQPQLDQEVRDLPAVTLLFTFIADLL